MKKTTIFLIGTLIGGNIFSVPLVVGAERETVVTSQVGKETLSTSSKELIGKVTENSGISEIVESSSTSDSTEPTQETSQAEPEQEFPKEEQEKTEISEPFSTEETVESTTESSKIEEQGEEPASQEMSLEEKNTTYTSDWLKQHFNVIYSSQWNVYRLDSIKTTNLTSIIIPSKVMENGQWIKVEATSSFWNSVKNYSNRANVTSFSVLKYDNYELGSWDQLKYSFYYLFSNYSSLLTVDFEGIDWSYVSNCYAMFYECTELREVNMSAGDDFQNVESIAFMFSFCEKLKKITNFDHADMSNVSSAEDMFQLCKALEDISGNVLQWKNFGANPNFNSTIGLRGMFYNCRSLTKIDIRSFVTRNIQNFNQLFSYCVNLKEVSLPYGDDAFTNATDMSAMFQECTELEEIKLDFGAAKLTNISRMFYGCNKLRKVQAYGFGLNATITNADRVFYTSSPTELIVINQNTGDYFMKYNGYASDNRIVMNTPKLDGNGGGFTDTNQTQKSYFTKIPYVIGEVSRAKFNQWLQQETSKLKRDGYTFIEWKESVSDLEPDLSADNLAFHNVTFIAQWKVYDYQTSIDNTLNPNVGELGIAYQPKAFHIGTFQLPSTGDKRIPITNLNGFNVGVKDLTGQTKEWTLTAQLVWDEGKAVPGAYLETTNNAGVVKQNFSNGSYSPTNDLKDLTQGEVTGNKNVKINTVSSEPIMSGVAGKKRDGVYDYNLNDVNLYIPDVSIVPGGTYSGQVNWNLTIAAP